MYNIHCIGNDCKHLLDPYRTQRKELLTLMREECSYCSRADLRMKYLTLLVKTSLFPSFTKTSHHQRVQSLLSHPISTDIQLTSAIISTYISHTHSQTMALIYTFIKRIHRYKTFSAVKFCVITNLKIFLPLDSIELQIIKL